VSLGTWPVNKRQTKPGPGRTQRIPPDCKNLSGHFQPRFRSFLTEVGVLTREILLRVNFCVLCSASLVLSEGVTICAGRESAQSGTRMEPVVNKRTIADSHGTIDCSRRCLLVESERGGRSDWKPVEVLSSSAVTVAAGIKLQTEIGDRDCRVCHLLEER